MLSADDLDETGARKQGQLLPSDPLESLTHIVSRRVVSFGMRDHRARASTREAQRVAHLRVDGFHQLRQDVRATQKATSADARQDAQDLGDCEGGFSQGPQDQGACSFARVPHVA